MSPWKFNRITPAQIVIIGFLMLILSGTALLMLPFSTNGPGSAPFLDALFTATSATCVTGLVVHDTFSYWSTFGQAVILILIQIGGMGIVTMAIAISIFTGKKIGFRQRLIMQESISAPKTGGIIRMTSFILKTTLIIEGIGAFLLAFRFIPQFGLIKGIWYSVFHSISAFCNAGFDLMGVYAPCSSLTSFEHDPLVNIVVILLIIIGGIGFFVWDDIKTHKQNWHAYRLQTKIVISTSALLIVLPFIYFFFYEFQQDTWADLTMGERFLGALFQTVTPRTAGFNTVDFSLLKDTSLLIMIFLMLIGGSPGSTAGGFKTTTIAMLFLSVRSVFKKQETITAYQRRIPTELLRNTLAILTMYLILFLSFGACISCIDGLPLKDALFETASAIGTVGLSLGITSSLGPVSRVLIILLMYFGRVGGLTMIYAVSNTAPAPFKLPQENITIG